MLCHKPAAPSYRSGAASLLVLLGMLNIPSSTKVFLANRTKVKVQGCPIENAPEEIVSIEGKKNAK